MQATEKVGSEVRVGLDEQKPQVGSSVRPAREVYVQTFLSLSTKSQYLLALFGF